MSKVFIIIPLKNQVLGKWGLGLGLANDAIGNRSTSINQGSGSEEEEEVKQKKRKKQ
jgi:hypothetical protein